MKKNIKKSQFLNLCEALELGVITTEQFYVLTNKDPDVATSTIEGLKLLENKDNNIFDALCNNENYFNIYEIIKKYEVYRTDIKRQQFIIENQDNIAITKIANILQNDNIWSDKEFVNILLNKSTDIMAFLEIYRDINDLLASNDELFNNEKDRKIIKKIISQNYTNVNVLLDYLKIDSLRQSPVWFDYLTDYYNNERNPVNYKICFYSFEEAGCMEKLTQKLIKITNASNSTELFSNFFKNIVSIKDFSGKMSDEEQEEYHIKFNALLHYSTKKPDDFGIIREITDLIFEKKLDSDKLEAIYQKVVSCQDPNVQSLVIEIYRNYSSAIINDQVISNIRELSYDEAQNYLLSRGVEINDEKYIAKMKKYYGESLSSNLVDYINREKLTKEKLLEIRDNILKSPTIFDGENFVVDSASFIDNQIIEDDKNDVEISEPQLSPNQGQKATSIKNNRFLKRLLKNTYNN